jgi:nucleotide-binding universal stress UspA family protein
MILLKRVLVATDFSASSDRALMYGRAIAKRFGASLHLLHVAENSFLRPVVQNPHAIMAAKTRTLNDRLTTDDRLTLRACAVIEISDAPAKAIVEYAKAEAIDLIVIGTHGRDAASQMLAGSVAERVVRLAPCPVLTVRHPEREFVFPDFREQRGGHDSPQEDPRGN